MMKKKLLFILSLTFIGISCFACLDDETKYVTQKKTNYPLTAFAVAVNNVQTGTTSYYHGKIDQTQDRNRNHRKCECHHRRGLYIDGRSEHFTRPRYLYTKLAERAKGDCHHREQSVDYLYHRTTEV